MAAPRTIASNAAPAGRKSQTETIGTTRPELHVIKATRVEGNGIRHGFEQLITWTRTRSTPLLHLVIAAVFLGVCLLGSLMLRTQMVQNSFEASQIETHITQLTQDVEDDQAKLAEEMCRVTQKRALSFDLKGYQANASGVYLMLRLSA